MTTTETRMQALPKGYEPEAPLLPRIVCIGNISDIGDGHPSANNPDLYIVQPFKISPLQAGREMKGNFTYHPEFFRDNFSPASLEDSNVKFVFLRNIAEEGRITTLRGMCGSEAAFLNTMSRLFALPEVTPEAVTEVLRTSIDPQTIVGYVLQERRDKTGDFDDQGRIVRKRSGFYEVGEWFYPDADGIKRQVAIAGRAPKGNRARTILAFEV